MHILLAVADEHAARRLVEDFEARGHRTELATSGLVAFTLPVDNEFDAILIDEGLPYLSGPDIARHLRWRRVHKPIILTSDNGSDGHRRVAREAGVDQCLIKPVTAAEIEAGIDSVIHRRETIRRADRMRVDDLEIDRGRRTVTRAGRSISLSRTQFLLLWMLAKNANQVVSRQVLYDSVWKFAPDATSNALDSSVSALRRQLSLIEERDPIVTRRGVGYALVTEG